MKYFEMFAGVGGFGLGIQRAYVGTQSTNTESEQAESEVQFGRERASPEMGRSVLSPDERDRRPVCVGFSEIDPHASAVLRYHYPDVKNYGDCKTINWSEVPDFDLLVGGSPCQDFSIAGKRAGLVGARSGLAYEYIRCLEEKHPAHFIWENVRGVLSSNRGWDFAAILNQMAQAGYSLQWQVLNAKHFGVPQNRERVFVIGTRTDLGSPREVFFEQGAGGKDIQDVAGGEAGVLPTIRATHYKSGDNQPVIRQLEPGAGQANRRYDPKGIAPTVPATGGGRHIPMIDPKPIEGRIRRLMPIECERLMSWPDGHTAKGRKEDGTVYEVSDTQRYKMCGNGVVSEVVAHIVKELFR